MISPSHHFNMLAFSFNREATYNVRVRGPPTMRHAFFTQPDIVIRALGPDGSFPTELSSGLVERKGQQLDGPHWGSALEVWPGDMAWSW